MSGMLPLALFALTAGAVPAAPPAPSSIIAAWVRGNQAERPRISLWLNRDEVYSRGDEARVYFKSDEDAYVTVIRIDTDGRVRVLFPIDPWEDNWARGGKTFEVLGRDRDEAFRVDDYEGVGYVFAIASQDQFNYDDIIRGDHWDYRAVSDGRVRGDPYVAVSDLGERIAVAGAYDYDMTQYHVGSRHDYPRFVCYDCHAYASPHYWNPYSHHCSQFRIVIYDDWYYYPYRYYPYGYYSGGVVVVRPYQPGPRYVFKNVDGQNDYITRVAQRPSSDAGTYPQTVERDRTSSDVGGRGAIPAPVSPRRRSPSGDRAAQGSGSTSAPERRAQPDATSNGATPSGASQPAESPPRRRPSGRTESGNLRDTESPQAEPSRREPSQAEPRSTGSPGSDPPRAEPSRRMPEPGRSEPSRAEPSRQTPQPGRAEPSRAEPSRRSPEPSRAAPPQSQPPRSTGAPQLKRRRPN